MRVIEEIHVKSGSMANSIDSVVLSSVQTTSSRNAKTTSKQETSEDRLGQAARLSVTPDAIADQAAIVSLSGSGSLTGVVNASIAVGGPDISGLQNREKPAEPIAGQEFENIIRTATSSVTASADSSDTEAVDASETENSSDSVVENVDVDDSDGVDAVDSAVVPFEIDAEEEEEDENDQGENEQGDDDQGNN